MAARVAKEMDIEKGLVFSTAETPIFDRGGSGSSAESGLACRVFRTRRRRLPDADLADAAVAASPSHKRCVSIGRVGRPVHSIAAGSLSMQRFQLVPFVKYVLEFVVRSASLPNGFDVFAWHGKAVVRRPDSAGGPECTADDPAVGGDAARMAVLSGPIILTDRRDMDVEFVPTDFPFEERVDAPFFLSPTYPQLHFRASHSGSCNVAITRVLLRAVSMPVDEDADRPRPTPLRRQSTDAPPPLPTAESTAAPAPTAAAEPLAPAPAVDAEIRGGMTVSDDEAVRDDSDSPPVVVVQSEDTAPTELSAPAPSAATETAAVAAPSSAPAAVLLTPEQQLLLSFSRAVWCGISGDLLDGFPAAALAPGAVVPRSDICLARPMM